MKISKLLSVVVAAASTLFVALSARAEFTCELEFPSAPSTTLANFPVLVRLADDAPTGFSYVDCPTGDCIWFTDENDDAIPCEVDTWDTTGESLIWVSVPSLSSSTKITMHWDAAGAPSGLPTASQVWTRAGYNAVWHFNGSNVESVTNLVPTTTRGTPTCDGNATYPGPLGKTLWLNGSSDLRYDPDPAWTTLGDGSALSVSFWVRVTGGAGFTRMVSCMSDWNKPAGYEFTLQSSYTKITVGTSGGSQLQTDITTGPNTTWKHFAGTYSGTTVKFYDDGVKKGEGTKNTVVAPTEALTLGGTGGTGTANPLTGGLDEIRIRRVTSSDDWVAAEYATATDADYVTFGEVESGGGDVEYLRLGTSSVADITAFSATVSGRLTKLGDGATSASVALVYTDGTVTNSVALGSTNAVPADFSVPLANLAPSTAYTAWFSAVNDATPPASTNSVAIAFSTGADATEWDTATATFSPDGRTIAATIDITNVGSGTSTLYLLTGSSAAAATTVSASVPVTSSGTKTVTADLSDLPWGSRVYYSLMLVNGTEANAVTNTYNPSAYKDIQDNSTYTWIGGSSGVWNDPTQWNRTAAGALATTDFAGYPVYGSTAVFSTAVGDNPVTVTVPATPGTSIANGSTCWFVTFLNLADMHMPLTFTSDTTDWTSRIYIYGFASGNTGQEKQKNYIRVKFDHCAVQNGGDRFLGSDTVDENGENFTMVFTHGTIGDIGNVRMERPAMKIRVEKDSLVSASAYFGGISDLTKPPPILDIEDAEFRLTGNKFEPDTNGRNATLVRLSGHHPKFTATYFAAKYADAEQAIEFVVPAGGYLDPPLHFFNDNILGTSQNGPINLRIATNSPALFAGVATTTRFVNAKVADGETNARVTFDLPEGVTTSVYTDPNGNADGYVVSIPAGPGPALTNVAITSCKDNSFTVEGSVSIATANESATITSYVAEDGGDFAAKGTTTCGGGAFSVKAAGLVAGAKYRWYVEAVTPSGSFRTVEKTLTFYPGAATVSAASVAPIKVDGEKVYIFTNSLEAGSITFSQGGLVEVLVVGGGGAGGNGLAGGGGGGAFLYRDDFIPAGTYEVVVGKGGYNTGSSSVGSVPAESSSIGDIFVAPGGGAGGYQNSAGTALGGSGGGNAGSNSLSQRGIWPFGTDGGSGSQGNNPSAGGGGAAGPGGDARAWSSTMRGGVGGDGISCSITGESKIYAAGGGGGGGQNATQLPGYAGLGGVPGSAYTDTERHNAPDNTGSGGGGGGWANNDSRAGGSGGSGIVVIRVKKFSSIGLHIIVR